VIEPVISVPAAACADPGAVQLTTPLLPAWRFPDVITAVPTYGPPAKARLHAPVIIVLAEPMFCNGTRQTSGVPEHDTVLAETWAVLVNVPKSPNTNPAIATEAMRVIAMRRTVARTGEMAFLSPRL